MSKDMKDLAVQEVTLRMNVMLQAESPEAAEAAIRAMSTNDLGQAIGISKVIAARSVADDQVMHRLLEYGDDGSFFEGASEVAAKDPRNGDMEIVGLQIRQGWSSETLMQLAGNFLREAGLQEAFAAYLEGVAEQENSFSPRP